jgi:RNA polymerase sigma-70 factor, ECF subfamily
MIQPCLVGTDATDGELARRVQERAGGSNDAEAELCRRFAPRVRSYGLRHLRSSDGADELVQRVLVVVIEKLRGQDVREVESIASFVLGTAHHVTMAMRRGDAKLLPLSEIEEPSQDPPPPALDVRRVVTCMGELAERDRTVVALSFFDEMSAPEIAEAVGTSAGNVRVMRHRALAALRECFERQAVAS